MDDVGTRLHKPYSNRLYAQSSSAASIQFAHCFCLFAFTVITLLVLKSKDAVPNFCQMPSI